MMVISLFAACPGSIVCCLLHPWQSQNVAGRDVQLCSLMITTETALIMPHGLVTSHRLILRHILPVEPTSPPFWLSSLLPGTNLSSFG